MEAVDLPISYNWGHNLNYPEIVKKLQQENSLIVINEFPLDDNELQSFINHIGIILKEKRNNNAEGVFDVKIARQNNFFTSVANSNLAFPLHTDCADFDSVPNTIGLLCVEPADENQGTNNFMYLNTLLNHLSETEKQQLLNKKWKFRNQEKSILRKENGIYKICYDRITLESFSELNRDEIDINSKRLIKRIRFNIN